MKNPHDRVPKRYRLRLHRLKNLYRAVIHQEPVLDDPTTEEGAERAISLLERALEDAGISIERDGAMKRGGAGRRNRA